MSEFDELVHRLRIITGYTSAETTAKPVINVEKQIDAESLLLLQHSLRRHPCFVTYGQSQRDILSELFEEVKEALEAPAGSEGHNNRMWWAWMNKVAEELEKERLRGVYADAEKYLSDGKVALLARLGMEEMPSFEANGEGYPCPWNVLMTLECRILFQAAFHENERAQLEVPNATTAILLLLQKVSQCCDDTISWLQLLHQLMRFPIASVRHVWSAALYFFPTSGPLVYLYIKLEIDQVAKKTRLEDCNAEADAKDVYADYLRILNTFYRHLSLSFSCDLYSIFFTFVQEYIRPDHASLDGLFRICLRRDVGALPHSTQLWMRYLSWRTSFFRDNMRRREWRKQMYRRILQIPLANLDKVKEEYDLFIASEYHGRIAPDEKIELEKRLVRVKAEAADLMKLMGLFYSVQGDGVSLSTPASFPPLLYLPRPLEVEWKSISSNANENLLSRIEMDLCAAWHALLQQVKRPLFSSSGGDVLHYNRYRAFLTMAACFFPHQVTLWMNLLDFCLNEQPLLSGKERHAGVMVAIDTAKLFHSSTVCFGLFLADMYYADLFLAEQAYRQFKDTLLSLRATLLALVKSEVSTDVVTSGQTSLQHITVAAVNFMRMSSTQGDVLHTRLVARFVMHQVDFLSLTLALAKKLLKSGAILTPKSLLRPFNTFCANWISLELIRSRAAADALVILQQWGEHLKMMLHSCKSSSWSCEDCGLDEQFLESCMELVLANAATCSSGVEKVLSEMEEIIKSHGIAAGNFMHGCRQLRHRFLLPLPALGETVEEEVLLHSHLLHPRAASLRYDAVRFSHSFLGEAWNVPLPPLMPSLCDAGSSIDVPSEKTSVALETYPEESMWSSADGSHWGGASSRHANQRRRRVAGAALVSHGDTNGGAPTALPDVAKPSASPLTIVVEAVNLPNLEECLVGCSVESNHGSEALKASEGKFPPLQTLEQLIIALPTMFEYSPGVDNATDISTDWLVETLIGCEALV